MEEYSIKNTTKEQRIELIRSWQPVDEAMDENDQEFGYERLLDILNRNQGKELSEVFEAVRTAVDDYSGKAGRFDDITMLALRLN